MKKTIRTLLCVLLAFCVSGEALTAAAHADFSCTEGEYFETCISQTTGEDDAHTYASASITSGNCPGVSAYVGKNGTGIMLGGTAGAAGTYMLTVTYAMRDGQTDTITAVLNVNPKSTVEKKTVEGTLALIVGQEVDGLMLYVPTGTLDDITLSWNGLTLSNTTVRGIYGLYLNGKPEEGGEHVFSASNINDGGNYELDINVNIVVTEAGLNITKSPTGETVEEETDAWFVAHCDNDKEIQWCLIAAGGNPCYCNEEITAHFPGLRVSGLYTDELHLENIPRSVSGWYVQARFLDSRGNTAESDKALLTVLEKPKEQEKPEATPEPPEGGIPTEGPEEAPAEEPVEMTAAPAPVEVIRVEPEPEPEKPEEKPKEDSNALIFIIAGIGGAAVVAVTVAVSRLKAARQERGKH